MNKLFKYALFGAIIWSVWFCLAFGVGIYRLLQYEFMPDQWLLMKQNYPIAYIMLITIVPTLFIISSSISLIINLFGMDKIGTSADLLALTITLMETGFFGAILGTLYFRIIELIKKLIKIRSVKLKHA